MLKIKNMAKSYKFSMTVIITTQSFILGHTVGMYTYAIANIMYGCLFDPLKQNRD